MFKLSKVTTPLLPHQERVVRRMQEQPGLLVAHGLGTGKTLSSIAVADALGGSSRALVPASLQANFQKELEKHTDLPSSLEVASMQRAALRDEATPSDLLIVDEAHRARETSTKLYQLLKDYPATRRMLLTASPTYNRPSDIAPLVNIVAGERVLPTGRDFDKRFIRKPPNSLLSTLFGSAKKPELQRKKELKGILDKWVDYHQATGGEFPDRIDESVVVPMDAEQTKLHNFAWGKLPLMARLRLQAGLPPQKKDLSSLNAFQSQSRQVGGSTKRFGRAEEVGVSPKLRRAISDLSKRIQENPEHKAVVYSNYLDTIGDYAQELENQNVPHAVFSGNLPQKQRAQAVQDYNAGKLKALLVSSAGGEGLDLKGTRQLQVLEPHWNEEKLDQVIGRAIRHGSHAHLPEDQRDVTVQRYLTHPAPGWFDRLRGKQPLGVEQVLSEAAADKKTLNQKLLDLMEQR
jgi:SNF2 family DNA or RNA helicase